MPEITVRGTAGSSQRFHFEQAAITVGRSEANDLVIRDPALSRFHAEIRREGQGWVVADRGSRNGIRVNGAPVKGRSPIVAGDKLTLGQTLVLFDAPLPDALPEGADPELFRGTSAARGKSRDGQDVLVGKSPAMQAVLTTIDKVAPTDSTVLITGENGTGKELAARLLHRRSRRSRAPFVVVNCPALPQSLMESELFGVERGVATGVEAREGLLEIANGGTLLLDEVGDLELSAQAKLLRFMQQRTIERVGGRQALRLDVRIVAATNHDLLEALEARRFRADLYHRLNVVSLHLPPLRERAEDVPLLIDHFLSGNAGPRVTVSAAAVEALSRYPFPGNVRELEHLLERAQLLCEGGVIQLQDLPGAVRDPEGAAAPPARGLAVPAELYDRIVRGGESFWEVVRKPYLRREIGREDVRNLLLRGFHEGGDTYKGLAKIFRVEEQYKKLVDFIRHHGLHPDL
jgi:pSer/pThr/pTyr-binding forkhead associated (FHA) protein